MISFRLYKKEKLCSLTAIETLFSRRTSDGGFPVASVMAYPWRAVWRVDSRRAGVAKFLISVPKKRLRHAVDRVKMRRRCREAYRLHRDLLPELTAGVDIAFIYVGEGVLPYDRTERSVCKILKSVCAALERGDAGKNESDVGKDC